MKFLSSSSVSSTTTFDGNSRNDTSGCIAGVLRRLLCFDSLPTHPSDHIREAENESMEFEKLQYIKTEDDNNEASATPGLVARLMGLESMPRIDLESTKISPNSIARSKSMNSVDSMKEWKSKSMKQGRHRRVKSFLEAPTFLELEDEKFFILSFENREGTNDLKPRARKSELGFGEQKQSKAEKCKKNNQRREILYEKNKENHDTNRVLNEKISQNSHVAAEVVKRSKPINHKQNTEGGRSRKKKKENCLAIDKVETECESRNSSPVSVLDFGEFPINPETPPSEDSRFTSSNSRRTLLGELENYKHLYPCKESIQINGEAKRIERKYAGSRKKNYKGQNCIELWGEICKFTERDIMQSNWMKLNDFEAIGADFGLEILDHLLSELVDQLLVTSIDNI